MTRVWFFAVLAACGGADRPAAGGVPQRIVSQTVDGDETLWALGEDVRARVVGVSKMADDRRYSTVAEVWPASVPRIPGTSEALVAAQPDLVIIAEFSAAETRALLQHAGITTLALEGYDGFEDYRERVRAMASAVGDAEGGTALVAEFDAKLQAASSPAGDDAPGIVSWVEGNVPGERTTFDEQARAAGFRNMAGAHGLTGHQRVGLEQIVAWDPEYIVIHCGEDDCAEAQKTFAASPGIASTRAGRHDRILAIQSSLLLTTGAKMVDVVERLRTWREQR
jgi:ABC-type Fe3+-hydroxamate transport system substrate-binding protein